MVGEARLDTKEKGRQKEVVVHIKITRAMADLKLKLNKMFGIIRVVFGNPSLRNIVVGLHKASDNFKAWTWDLKEFKDGFFTGFPCRNHLFVRALKFDVIKCREGGFGLHGG